MDETRRVNTLAWQSLFHLSCHSLFHLLCHIIPAKTGFSIGTALCPSCGSNGRTTYNLFSALFCWVRRLVPLLFHVVANVQVLKSDLQQREGHVFLIAGSMSWRVSAASLGPPQQIWCSNARASIEFGRIRPVSPSIPSRFPISIMSSTLARPISVART